MPGDRRSDVLKGAIFPKFTSELQHVKQDLDFVKLAPALLNAPWYCTPSELAWALSAAKSTPAFFSLLNCLFERAQDDDEALYTELGSNTGSMIGQIAFKSPWEPYAALGIESTWAAIAMRQFALDRLAWTWIVLSGGTIPLPVHVVFAPYPQQADADADALVIRQLLREWRVILYALARSLSSTESLGSTSNVQSSNEQDAPPLEPTLSLLDALGAANSNRHVATVFQNLLFAALGLQALMMVSDCVLFHVLSLIFSGRTCKLQARSHPCRKGAVL